MGKMNLKKFAYDIFIDVAGGILIGVGIYNFAANADFPMAGVSGIALIFYHLFGFPIGWGSIVLNVPIVILCFKMLGKEFFARSVKTLIITSLITDYIAPLFPVYSGDRILAAICTGIFAGLGYAIIFTNNTSTGGTDFIMMAIKLKNPHLTLGRLVFIIDSTIVLIGGIILQNVDGTIYGFVISYLMSVVMDKVMYGIDPGKVTLIVTEKGQQVSEKIDKYSGRGSTILKGRGSYSGVEKDVVMCACSTKQMYTIRKLVKDLDPKAFTVIMESNEVVGEGFQEE